MKLISKKRAFKHFRKRCPDGPRCVYCLRRLWMSKKYGYYHE